MLTFDIFKKYSHKIDLATEKIVGENARADEIDILHEFGLVDPDLEISSSIDIVGKGSSTISLTNGVKNRICSLSVQGNGTLSATSATFDDNGNASVTVTGKYPYSGVITVSAQTDYNKSASLNVNIAEPKISISSSKSLLDGEEDTCEISVQGGYEGESVSFTVAGASLSVSNAVFDSDGIAKVVLSTPTDENISVSASYLTQTENLALVANLGGEMIVKGFYNFTNGVLSKGA